MRQSRWMVLSTIGILLASAAAADEAKFPDDDRAPAASQTLDRPVTGPAPVHGWQLHRPASSVSSRSDYWVRPIADIEFQDSSALGRLSKLRNLALLTLAESARSRLFLGVNDDGLVGLHFVASPANSDERYLSVARMPYLKKKHAAGEVE